MRILINIVYGYFLMCLTAFAILNVILPHEPTLRLLALAIIWPYLLYGVIITVIDTMV